MHISFVFMFSIWFFWHAFYHWLMITGISWTILYGGCSGKHQDSEISNSFAMWTLWCGGFTAGRYFSRILVVLLCLVGRFNLVWGSLYIFKEDKIIFTFLTWCFAAYPDFHATGPIYGADYLSSVSWRTGNCAGMLHLSEFTRNH